MHEIEVKRRFAITFSLVLAATLALTAVPSQAVVNPAPTCLPGGARSCTIVFDSPASTYNWVIPVNASGLHIHVVGGTGGNAFSDASSPGGVVTSALALDQDVVISPGASISISVGGGGSTASSGTGGGGGTNPLGTYAGGRGGNAGLSGSSGGGGGGGAATVVTFGTQTIVAAGTGGAGGGSWNVRGLNGSTAIQSVNAGSNGAAGLVIATDGGGGGGGGGGLLGGIGGIAGCDHPPTSSSVPCEANGIAAGGGYAGTSSTGVAITQTTVDRSSSSNGFVSITYQTSTYPSSPTISSVLTGNGSVQLGISAPDATGSSPVIRYEYTTKAGLTWYTLPAIVAGTSQISGLKNASAYTVRIRAVNTAGAGDVSESVTFTPTNKVPTAPKLQLVSLGNGQASLLITAPSGITAASVIGYQLSKDDGASWNDVSINAGALNVSGLTNGVNTYLRLRAIGTNGAGVRSNHVIAKPFTNPTAPVLGTVVAASGQLTATFTAPSDNGGSLIKNYQYSTDGGATWISRSPVKITSPLVVTGLTNGSTYDFTLRAVTALATGAPTQVTQVPLTFGLLPLNVQLGAVTNGATPFIRFVKISGVRPGVLSNISFAIAPKSGSATLPISATYSKAYLLRNNYLDVGLGVATIPVFGLYSNYSNSVSFKYFEGSNLGATLTASVSTPVWTDPYGPSDLYKNPVRVVPRNNNVALDFSYFMMKSASTGSDPVVLDTDGEVRWVGVNNEPSQSSIFYKNAMYVGTGSHLTRTQLDGRYAQVADYRTSNGATNTGHHNYDPGKFGFLLETDTTSNVESTILEVDSEGAVLNTFDLAAIIEADMVQYGDNPSGFVRRGADWFHNNAAVYWPAQDTLVVSSRENFVIGIDYTTKKIKWILGDNTKLWHQYPSLRRYELTMAAGSLAPIGQHAVSITSDNQLMLFDNGKESMNQSPVGATRYYSAPRKYQINLTAMSATETWHYDHSPAIWSPICSSIYQDGSSYLINYASENLWGSGPLYVRMVAIDSAKNIAFEYRYPGNWGTSWNTSPIHLENLIFN